MEELFRWVSTGGDLVTVGIFILLYRFDKRLNRLEFYQELRQDHGKEPNKIRAV